MDAFNFIVFCREIHVSKQCRPSSDATLAASKLGLYCLNNTQLDMCLKDTDAPT